MTEVARPAHMAETFTVQQTVEPDAAISPTSDSGVVLASEGTTPVSESPLAEPSAPTVSTEHMAGKVPNSSGGHSQHAGPDNVLPTQSQSTTVRDAPVRLRMGDKGINAQTPISVISFFRKTVEKVPATTAMAVKRGGQWVKWTYKKYYEDVWRAAKSFQKLGLEPYHGVGIVGFNTPEWFISDIAAIFAGGFAVGIYTTNSADACQYVADNSQCNIIVVENDQQLQKILKVRDQLPHLRAVIQYDGKPKENYPNVYSWSQFMEVGKDVPDSDIEDQIRQMAPNKCCTLIYTSGTTGSPKGVMLSHDNCTWTAQVATATADLHFGNEHVISYLPLSHIAAQMIDIYVPMLIGGTVWFAQPDALKGTLGDTMKEVRPTAMFGVPRVWEKIQEKMVAVGKSNTGLRKKIAAWARGVGLKANLAMMTSSNGSIPSTYGFAKKLVFKKVRLALGLDRCRICLTGAAPITKETLEFFASLDIPLMELYGMSESSGPHTVNVPKRWKMMSVGPDMLGATTKLVDQDKDGNGEICMNGRHVFMGYLNMEEKTKEALDADGWLHSGDIGKRDRDGFLYITGRIKELIITAGGENVAPVPIEDIVKEELPIVSNAMLIGDKHKFLSLLLTLKTEVDLDTGAPKNRLTQPAIEWCQSIGSDSKTLSDVLDRHDEKILKAIQSGIDRSNNRSSSRAQKIQKWSILPRDFSIPGGELGPTLKLKRTVVSSLYEKTINAFYAES